MEQNKIKILLKQYHIKITKCKIWMEEQQQLEIFFTNNGETLTF